LIDRYRRATRTVVAARRWHNGPLKEIPGPGDEYNANKLVEDYGWLMVELADEDSRFKAAYWVSENCGEEYIDYIYEPKGKWLFRNHEAGTMFKLMFG
jgi:hypothetical protein